MVINTNFDQVSRTPANSISSTYKKIASVFIFGTIILLGVILYFSLARANIYLKVKSQSAKINFTTQIKEGVTDNNYLETNILNGRIVEIIVEKTKEFNVSEKTTPGDKYGGLMKIINQRGSDQTLIATTRFQSQNGKIFRTQEKIIVPAKGSINAYVMADAIGEEYAEAPGKFIIPGLNTDSQKYIYGELQESMKKESITTSNITKEDFDKAEQDLVNDLKLDALSKLRQALNSEENLEKNAIFTEVVSKSSNKNIGEKISKFEYTIKIKVVGAVFDKEELLTLGQSLIDKQLEQGRKLLNYDNESFIYKITNYSSQEKSVTMDAELSANVIQDSESELFKTDKFKSLTQQEIIDYFRVIPGIENVKVKFSPFWVKKAPKMANHIKVIIE